jgi:putative colanic acid biosynthesis UDP-glucose lipid carrier transferase
MAVAALDRAPRRTRVVSPVWGRRLLAAAMQVTDLLSIGFGAYVAHVYRFGNRPVPPEELQAIVIGVLICLVAFPALGATGIQSLERPWRGLRKMAMALTVSALMLIAVGYGLQAIEQYSRLWAGYWALATFVSLVLTRVWWAGLLKHGVDLGFLREQVAVICPSGEPALRDIFDSLDNGLTCPRFVVPVDAEGELDRSVFANCDARLFPSLQSFVSQVPEIDVDRAVIVPPLSPRQSLRDLVAPLRAVSLDVDVVPTGYDPELRGRQPRLAGDIPVVTILTRPLTDLQVFVKRAEDVVLGSLILLCAAPVMGLIALAVKLDSPGAALFAQKRAGFNNRPFTVYKFRTMKVHSDPSVRQATRDDDRITGIGAFLRRTSLDELPQLLNVLKGDMSLVGPRPHALVHDEEYSQLIDDYIARHRMKPGLTGWAQVNGWRGQTDTVDKMRKRVEHDLVYVDQWSLYFDMKILFMTFFVFTDKNAY